MTRVRKAFAAAAGLVLAAFLLTGCAAVREFVNEVAPPLPQPSLPAAAEPWEKIYQGGSRPDGLSEDEWATKSQRRITAAAALHKILVYGVDSVPGSDGLTVLIKGDPEDAQLISDVEQYVVPVALSWSPTVTVVVDPTLCGVVAELRDNSPLCDKLTGN